jgi:hypothetical protein
VRRKIDIKDESKEVRTKSKVQIQSRGGVGGGRGGGGTIRHYWWSFSQNEYE